MPHAVMRMSATAGRPPRSATSVGKRRLAEGMIFRNALIGHDSSEEHFSMHYRLSLPT